MLVKWEHINNEGKRDYNNCFGTPFVLYSSGDGKFHPCGLFFTKDEERYRLGDLTQASFIDIIHSDRYKHVMDDVASIDVQAKYYANCRAHAINAYV